MCHIRRSTIRLLLLLVLVCLPLVSTRAQTNRTSEQTTLESLLKEVRLLRETLQRINLATYRSQIVLERVRTQAERVARLSRDLESTRDDSANLQTQLAQMNDRAKTVELQILQESDVKQRSQLEEMQKELKSLADRHKQNLERIRERESRLTSDLQSEQAKLNDLEGRLDALEREFQNQLDRKP